jgi:hypothetical protein
MLNEDFVDEISKDLPIEVSTKDYDFLDLERDAAYFPF